MERLVYTALSAADMNQTSLRIAANNLANISTPGFKADIEQVQAVMIAGHGYRTRYQALTLPAFTDISAGAVIETGRDLDLVPGEGGLIAVSDANGNEAYTRAGSLQISASGELTVNGYLVRGHGGDITLPEFGGIDISNDGTINLLPVGGGVMTQDARIKLVSVGDVIMKKGLDGLLRTTDNRELDVDESVSVRSGFLEGSNVNAVEQMVNTMNISRQFEINVRMMKTAEELTQSGNKLINGNS